MKSNNENLNDSYIHREYNIKNENEIYNLRIEIDYININFKLKKLNESIDYIFKNNFKIISFINILDLNPSKFSNNELILKIFDKLYIKNNILIEEIDNNNDNINLKIRYSIFYDDIEKEIKLYKEYMNINDKINVMYNQLKLKNSYNEFEFKNDNIEIEEMKKEINELKLKINKKENENNINYQDNIINEIIDKKIDKIINNFNNEFKDKDKKIIELNNKIINQENEIKNKDKEIELINQKLENMNIILNDYQNNIINKDLNMNNNNNNKINNKNEKYFNDKIKEEKDITHIIDGKDNELIENKNDINESENELKLKEYKNKINYKYIKEPQNLKYKYDIINTNIIYGYSDIFETFTSYKDNKEYIISPNINNNNIDIFTLIDNKKILSLQGHNNTIKTIRYFINIDNGNEYLISADKNKVVIVWDITNYYNILYNINTNYEDDINSCLLIFSNIDNNNYFITSTSKISNDIDKSSSKIFSLNNGKLIKYINNSNNYRIYYLLSWYNIKENKYYIIEFANNKIVINNLLENKLYSELIQEPESNHFSGFIKNKDNKDYLYSSSFNGYINIWDLYNKSIFKILNINNCKLYNIIDWNDKYIMVADSNNKSFKIINIEIFKVISDIKGIHKNKVKSIKKIYHPIYGESLFSLDEGGIIKLWSI